MLCFVCWNACTGICLVDETDPNELLADDNDFDRGLVGGVKAAYAIPALAPVVPEAESNEVDTSGVSLDELMTQMKSI